MVAVDQRPASQAMPGRILLLSPFSNEEASVQRAVLGRSAFTSTLDLDVVQMPRSNEPPPPQATLQQLSESHAFIVNVVSRLVSSPGYHLVTLTCKAFHTGRTSIIDLLCQRYPDSVYAGFDMRLSSNPTVFEHSKGCERVALSLPSRAHPPALEDTGIYAQYHTGKAMQHAFSEVSLSALLYSDDPFRIKRYVECIKGYENTWRAACFLYQNMPIGCETFVPRKWKEDLQFQGRTSWVFVEIGFNRVAAKVLYGWVCVTL